MKITKIEEYKKELKCLAIKHKEEFEELKIKFVEANNPYKVGDIIEDHMGKIKIEKFGVYTTLDHIPKSTYFGIELKKNNEPKKNNKKRTVYQENIKIS